MSFINLSMSFTVTQGLHPYLHYYVVWHADIDAILDRKTSSMLSQMTCKPSWNPLRKKELKKIMPNPKKKKMVIHEYDAFLVTKSTGAKINRVRKNLGGFSIKRRCLCCFVARQSYLDPSLCMLVYENTMHLNALGEHCHGSMVSRFRYALGAGISQGHEIQNR